MANFILKSIFFLTLFSAFLFSCTGDCASCHQNLDYKNDARHSSMAECKTCHTDEKMSKIDMGDVCGSDCFACHDADKLNSKVLQKDHGMINSCISCIRRLKIVFLK